MVPVKARVLAWTVVALTAVAGGLIWKMGMGDTRTDVEAGTLRDVIPAPARVEPAEGTVFALTESSVIVTSRGQAEAVGQYLAGLLRSATGYPLPVRPGEPAEAPIALVLGDTPDQELGTWGYVLDITAKSVVLRAPTPAGLFWGVQTLRQLLPVGGMTVHNVRPSG